MLTVLCENLRLPNPLFSRARQKSAHTCKNLRKHAKVVRFLPFNLSHLARHDALQPNDADRTRSCLESSGAWRGAPDGVATLKVRKGAFDALNKGSGALGKVK